jgi:hypothetical protein
MRVLSTLLLLLLPLSTPAMADPTRDGPVPERVYRQLRRDPAIRTREEALEFLAEVSPSDLRNSAKLSVDERIKDLLSHPGFDSLDEGVQSRLHASMLEIRSSFWAEDLEKLASAEKELRQLWKSGGIVSKAENRKQAEQLQDRLLDLVEEVEMAVALQSCARPEHDLGTAGYLDCLLRGGPGD